MFLSKVSPKVAKVKHATKLFLHNICSRVKNQFSKGGHATIWQLVFNHKKFLQLRFESLDKLGVFEQKLRGTGTGWTLRRPKCFTTHTCMIEVTVTYCGTTLNKPSRWKDLRSDFAILTGWEKHNRPFKQGNHHLGNCWTRMWISVSLFLYGISSITCAEFQVVNRACL